MKSAPGRPSRTDQNLRDAISRNETAALWSAGAVVFGLILEVIFVAAFHEPPETIVSHWGPVAADAIVALGVAGEVFFGRKSRIDSEELTRRSEERAARLEKEAAEAHERTAEIERLTGFRRVSYEQLQKIRSVIRPLAGTLNLLIEYQYGDTEAFVYARDLSVTFRGIATIRLGPNSFLDTSAFGLFVAASPAVDIELIAQSFIGAGIEFGRLDTDLSTHLPGNVPAPNLYIFVAPKPPPPLTSPEIATKKSNNPPSTNAARE
jgi:hypothetical protein